MKKKTMIFQLPRSKLRYQGPLGADRSQPCDQLSHKQAVFMYRFTDINNNNASDVLQAGPIRLFVPYKRRKRESSQSGSPVLKKSLSLSSENSRREGKDSRLKMGTLNK